MKVQIPVVDCYGRETEASIEISECNVNLVHFTFKDYNGEEVKRYLKIDDLKTLAKVF